MEDKYFNEFFDKLYNGKLNIYEDEEDVNINEINIKTPEQNFNDFLRDVENVLNGKLTKYLKNSLRNIINDEELTNTFVYANKNNREETKKKYNDWCEKNTDKCKKLKEILYINSPFDDFLRDVEIALDGYKDITSSNRSKIKKALKLIIYPEESMNKSVPTAYANQNNREKTIEDFNDWCNIEENKKKCGEIKEKLSKPRGYVKRLKHITIPEKPEYTEDELEKIIGKKRSKNLIPSVKIALEKDYKEFTNDFKNTYLNGFLELYGMKSNIDQNKAKPVWRKYIREDEGFKEYLKNFIKEKYPKFEERLNELYYRNKFAKTLGSIFSDVKKIYEKDYKKFTNDFKKRKINGFWELYNMESNDMVVPVWRKYIREDKGFKEYLKNYIKEKRPKFEERLNELYYQRRAIQTLDNLHRYDTIKKIYEKDYRKLDKDFRKTKLNGFWELYNMESNNMVQPVWRNYIREEEGFKEYLKNLIEEKYPKFEERLNELSKQKNNLMKDWEKFQKSFTGLFNYDSDRNDGTQYFKEKEWKNPYRKIPQDESLESESQIHTLWDDNDDVNLINFINEKVNECYKEVPSDQLTYKDPIIIGDKRYQRIKLKKDVSCPLSGNPKKIPGFKEWLEGVVVKKVKNHVLDYLKTDGVKVKKFDLECVSPIGDVIKEGFKIEVKHQRKLDGRFANYISSAGSLSNVPSVLGREIYKEFVYTLLGRDKEGNVNVDKDSKFIYDKIIEDNCKHFDGMFIGESERKNLNEKDKLIIYVPKEYIKFYISTESQRSINFTLRYHVDPENVDNFYKVVRPEDYKNDNKYSNDLIIEPLNEFDKKKVKRWRGKMVNPIYMYDGDGLCPPGQSVNESYDSYLDQLVENFFNTGKLNIYEDEEDVNINEGGNKWKTKEEIFDDFLSDVEIVLNGKLTKYLKNSLRNIINDEELTNTFVYANKNNREETKKKYNDWCEKNTDNKQKCEKLKKILYINSPFDDFLTHVEIALNDDYKDISDSKKSIIKNSLRLIIYPNKEGKSKYVYAKKNNREETKKKYNKWCGENEDNKQKCEELIKKLPKVVHSRLNKPEQNFNDFLRDVEIVLNGYEGKSRVNNSLRNIINDEELTYVYAYAKENNREVIRGKFNEWCGENEDNKQKCEKLKKIIYINSPFDDFLRDVEIALNGKIELSEYQKDSLRNIINDEELTHVYAYANQKNKENTKIEFNKWCTCEGEENKQKCEENKQKCEEIKKLVNKWEIKEWIRYEESFAKKYGETQYFKNLNKGKRDFKESRIHDLDSEKIKIPEIINKLTKDCTDNGLCDLERKEQVEKRITKVVRDNIETFLDHEETKVKKFDLECLEPLKLNGETIIDKNYRIEVKMKTMLDGVFATYLSSPLSKLRITNDFGKQIYDEFVDDLLKGDKFIFERIIWDNCQHFDGIILSNNIFVPKEYITLYISSKNKYYEKNKVFTLRYNIDKSKRDNFYKIIKPRDNEPLKIRKLNEKEKSMLNGWYSDFTDKIYEKGKCPKKRSMDETYDSYLDQLVENFFNTGKLFP